MIYPCHLTASTAPLPIQLQLFGIDHLQPPVKRPDGVPYYQWFYCTKGQGEVLVNRQCFLIAPGEGFLILPDDPHDYQGLTDDWTLQIIGFSGPVCTELLKTLLMYESGPYHFSDPTFFLEHMEQIMKIYTEAASGRAFRFSKACYDFLLDISMHMIHSHSIGAGQENELVETIVTYLERNYQNPVSLSDLASIVNLSRDYMCALFKQHTGQTIIQYLLEIRIGHARHFLTLYPEKKILEIGKMCGFESPSYFGKMFKKEVGTTPEQYRRN